MSEKNSQDGLERLGFLTASASHISDLRIVNDDIKGIGAYLTEKGIHEVLVSRQSALARQARLQWSLEMTEKILERASSSPYAEQDTLPQVISDWFEVILHIQNQTSDFLADDDIIFAVAEYYDNFCGGDSDLLRGKGSDRIIKNFKMKRELSKGADERPGRESIFDDEEEEVAPEDISLPLGETFRRNVFAVRTPIGGFNPSLYEKSSEEQHTAGDNHRNGADHTAGTARPVHSDSQLRRKSNNTDEEAHEILALFQKELSFYVGEGASSVSERTGRNIFASVRYTLSLASDKNIPVDQRFCDGQRILLSLLEESEQNFRAILAMKIHLPLDTYYGTLYREIPAFFRLYDAQYAAHETPSLLDYPLALEIEDLSGIVYMHEYLHRLRIESEYVCRVPEALYSELIQAYSRNYDMDVTPVPVNFYDMLMGQAFAVALVLDQEGKNPASVWPVEEDVKDDYSWLYPIEFYNPTLAALAAMSFSERKEKLVHVCELVCACPEAAGPEVVEYAHIHADRWIILFESTLVNHCPENLILFPAVKQSIISDYEPSYFAEGVPMPDDEYTELIEKLSSAADVQEQNQLIRANVHSRKDLLDILQEDFWMPGEKEIFLGTFSSEEQALFAKEAEAEAPHLGEK